MPNYYDTLRRLWQIIERNDSFGHKTMRTFGRNMAWMIRKLNVSEDDSEFDVSRELQIDYYD